MRAKLLSASAAGADVLATACTYCQMQFMAASGQAPEGGALPQGPPAVLVTRLLCAALKLDTGDPPVEKLAERRKT